MPFDRMHVTRASLVMLPFYIAFDVVLGLTWLTQDENRTNASLDALRGVWPLAGTSVVLFACAALLATALLTHNRALCGFALTAGALAYFMLAAVFCIPLGLDWQWAWPLVRIDDPVASLSAPYWPIVPAVAQVASMLTVLFEETRSPGMGD